VLTLRRQRRSYCNYSKRNGLSAILTALVHRLPAAPAVPALTRAPSHPLALQASVTLPWPTSMSGISDGTLGNEIVSGANILGVGELAALNIEHFLEKAARRRPLHHPSPICLVDQAAD